MSLIGDLIDGVLEGTGWAAGVAIVLGVAAVGARRDSPLVKEVIKGYLTVSERVKEIAAEAGEQLQDLYAEARAEYEAGGTALATVGTPAAAAPRRRGRPRTAGVEGAAGPAEARPARRRGRASRPESAETEPEAAPRRGRPPRSAAASESGTA
jgi:hypothetical protein